MNENLTISYFPLQKSLHIPTLRSMKNVRYVVVDIETTGLSRERNRITEIAAARFDGNQIIEEWSSLVHPGMSIPSHITRLTGIDDDMVKNSPMIQEILPDFLSFMEEDIFVAHNSGFDLWFLSHNAKIHLDHEWTHEVLCTRKLANRLLKDLPNKRLGTICEYYGIQNTQAHRALADVRATVEVLGNFLNFLEKSLRTHIKICWFFKINR